MKPYCPLTKKGCKIAGHDVFRKTYDTSSTWRKASAKLLRKSARQSNRILCKKYLLNNI